VHGRLSNLSLLFVSGAFSKEGVLPQGWVDVDLLTILLGMEFFASQNINLIVCFSLGSEKARTIL
jgi:hypothetical protein